MNRLPTLILFLSSICAMAQPKPCGGGYDPVHDPRNSYAICLPQIGRMDGVTIGGGGFGDHISAVGDVDHSGTIDFVVSHGTGGRSVELLLYKGVQNGLPSVVNYQRIGLGDTNLITAFIAAGDWDNDSHVDIAVRIQMLGDTSAGNREGYDISRLVVFWGNDSGTYSLSDTTRLESGAQMWLSLFTGLSSDIDGDGVADLVVGKLSGFTNGVVVPLPQVMLFRGHVGKRWGRDGLARSTDWFYWKQNPDAEYNEMTVIDHDGDGVKDLVWYRNSGNRSYLSILYGSSTGLPDTNDVQTVLVGKPGASAGASMLADVTGDGIPELLAASVVTHEIKIYVGLKGQRLLEQYGSGNDSAHPGDKRWWGKPWASIWMPYRINAQWFEDVRMFDLGDANLDGVGDLFTFSWPYVMEYNGGDRLDSLADALISITPANGISALKRVGNIDGSGRDIIVLSTGNEIRFYVATRDVPSNGYDRILPPGTGPASVEIDKDDDRSALVLDALPNPSRNDVRFSWRGPHLNGPATIILYDLSAREVRRCDVRAESGSAHCAVEGVPAGTYLAQFRCGGHTAGTRVILY